MPIPFLDIESIQKDNKICSLIGVEGGHSISGSLAVLRTYYLLGVRYLTLTSTCHTPWADSSAADAPKLDVKHGGLTEFGKVTFIPFFCRILFISFHNQMAQKSRKNFFRFSTFLNIFFYFLLFLFSTFSLLAILNSKASDKGDESPRNVSRFIACFHGHNA